MKYLVKIAITDAQIPGYQNYSQGAVDYNTALLQLNQAQANGHTAKLFKVLSYDHDS